MKSIYVVLSSSAFFVLGLPHPAPAADLRVKAPIYKAPIAAPIYNWTGLYVGGNIGGAWSDITLTDNAIGASWNPGGTGFIGGLQTGYNLQAGNLLYGIEGDFDWTTFKGATGPTSTSIGVLQASTSKNWISTVAARRAIAEFW
jgi:hypothetical protein